MATINELRDLPNKINAILSNRRFLADLAKITKRALYRRVKSGKGVNSDSIDNPKFVRLKPLSKSYKDFRRGKLRFYTNKQTGKVFSVRVKPSKKPRLGDFATPARSNATFTGQMLDAIEFELIEAGLRLYINSRVRKDEPITSTGGGMSNDEVAKWYSINRPFFALTRDERQIIATRIEQELRKAAKRGII